LPFFSCFKEFEARYFFVLNQPQKRWSCSAPPPSSPLSVTNVIVRFIRISAGFFRATRFPQHQTKFRLDEVQLPASLSIHDACPFSPPFFSHFPLQNPRSPTFFFIGGVGGFFFGFFLTPPPVPFWTSWITGLRPLTPFFLFRPPERRTTPPPLLRHVVELFCSIVRQPLLTFPPHSLALRPRRS